MKILRPRQLRAAPGRAVAILREQGVNGHVEMAAAFDLAGFDATDVHMSDLANRGRRSLDQFAGFVACGGFSYGDVLGAGRGWAKSILFHENLREQFSTVLRDDDRKFALGVCNGCQMLAALERTSFRAPGPGPTLSPAIVPSNSKARFSLVRVEDSSVRVPPGHGRFHHSRGHRPWRGAGPCLTRTARLMI